MPKHRFQPDAFNDPDFKNHDECNPAACDDLDFIGVAIKTPSVARYSYLPQRDRTPQPLPICIYSMVGPEVLHNYQLHIKNAANPQASTWSGPLRKPAREYASLPNPWDDIPAAPVDTTADPELPTAVGGHEYFDIYRDTDCPFEAGTFSVWVTMGDYTSNVETIEITIETVLPE